MSVSGIRDAPTDSVPNLTNVFAMRDSRECCVTSASVREPEWDYRDRDRVSLITEDRRPDREFSGEEIITTDRMGNLNLI